MCHASLSPMKFISWNCRGLSCYSAIRSLLLLIRNLCHDVIYLSETKSLSLSLSQVSTIINILGFYLMSHVATSGFSRGLVLTWRQGIELECFVFNKNNIFAWCYSDLPNSPWILSCVYGPLNKRDTFSFWDSLTFDGENFVGPWLCIGNFNHGLNQSEKMGGRPVASSSHCPFKQFIDYFGMVDLGFAGNPFTW